jgi:hypothetical protein
MTNLQLEVGETANREGECTTNIHRYLARYGVEQHKNPHAQAPSNGTFVYGWELVETYGEMHKTSGDCCWSRRRDPSYTVKFYCQLLDVSPCSSLKKDSMLMCAMAA